MSHQYRSPNGPVGAERMPPFHTWTPRHISPQTWYSPPPHSWAMKHGTSPQGSRNPYYNQCPSPNGDRHSPRQWSPYRREPNLQCRRSWVPSPRSPHVPHFKNSPEHVPVYNERRNERTQVPFKQKRGYTKDISHYYSQSMVEDPWAELQAKDTKSTPQNLAKVHHVIAGSQAPL